MRINTEMDLNKANAFSSMLYGLKLADTIDFHFEKLLDVKVERNCNLYRQIFPVICVLNKTKATKLGVCFSLTGSKVIPEAIQTIQTSGIPLTNTFFLLSSGATVT